ncbi:somatostatin receptor type 1 isoform X2 [Lepisosteus oculatus]|uniref:somatostatin receptor type 1 isoform X2 n=1 Tax=Lepisosteus oculatus TaxID=7918 RepID=UPI0035F51A51
MGSIFLSRRRRAHTHTHARTRARAHTHTQTDTRSSRRREASIPRHAGRADRRGSVPSGAAGRRGSARQEPSPTARLSAEQERETHRAPSTSAEATPEARRPGPVQAGSSPPPGEQRSQIFGAVSEEDAGRFAQALTEHRGRGVPPRAGMAAGNGTTEPPSDPPFNASLGYGEPEQDVSKIVIPSIYALVCCVGLTGNAMVIYVILKYAKMKTATNIYILNLAIADELFMLSVPFLATAAALRRWPFGALACRLVLSVDGINMFTSVFCLTVLSVDRYIAVAHPIRAARYRRPTVAKAINVCVWALSLVVILPIIVFAGTVPRGDGGVECNFLWPEPSWSEAFVVYTFLLGFLLPVAAICLCYCLIVAKMRAVALRAGWLQRRRSEKKITRMVLLVVTVFVACWLPFYVAQLLSVFRRPPDPVVNQLFVVLSYANSGANPILYGFVSDNFRRSFQRLVCLRWMDSRLDAEQVDYCAVALRRPVPCGPRASPKEPLASEMVYHNGTCNSRTTTL